MIISILTDYIKGMLRTINKFWNLHPIRKTFLRSIFIFILQMKKSKLCVVY